MTSPATVRLSICIPVYNFGPFVGHALDSTLGQSGMDEDIEARVVDGASPGNTKEVAGERVGRWPNLHYVKLPKRVCCSDPGLDSRLTGNAYRYAPTLAYRVFLRFYHIALRLYRLAMVRN